MPLGPILKENNNSSAGRFISLMTTTMGRNTFYNCRFSFEIFINGNKFSNPTGDKCYNGNDEHLSICTLDSALDPAGNLDKEERYKGEKQPS